MNKRNINYKTVSILVLSSIAAILTLFAFSDPKPKPLVYQAAGFHPYTGAYKFKASGKSITSVLKATTLRFDITFDGIEFSETISTTRDCNYDIVIETKADELHYTTGKYASPDDIPDRTGECALFLAEKIDVLLTENYVNVKTWP